MRCTLLNTIYWPPLATRNNNGYGQCNGFPLALTPLFLLLSSRTKFHFNSLNGSCVKSVTSLTKTRQTDRPRIEKLRLLFINVPDDIIRRRCSNVSTRLLTDTVDYDRRSQRITSVCACSRLPNMDTMSQFPCVCVCVCVCV